jgi:hypothetical protein
MGPKARFDGLFDSRYVDRHGLGGSSGVHAREDISESKSAIPHPFLTEASLHHDKLGEKRRIAGGYPDLLSRGSELLNSFAGGDCLGPIKSPEELRTKRPIIRHPIANGLERDLSNGPAPRSACPPGSPLVVSVRHAHPLRM